MIELWLNINKGNIQFPFIFIYKKFNIWQNIRNKIEELFAFQAQNNEETPKKMEYFTELQLLKK